MAKIHGVAVDFLNDKDSITFYDDDGRGVTFIAMSKLTALVEEMETHWRTGGLTPTRKNDLWFWWKKLENLLRGE